MKKSNLLEYVKERYGNVVKTTTEDLCAEYERYMKSAGIQLFNYSYGFFTAHKKGDAFIVYDLYTTKEARKTGAAWTLFNDIKNAANSVGANVLIGFSEFAGQGQVHGKAAMNAAGFVKAYDTLIGEVYMRGTH